MEPGFENDRQTHELPASAPSWAASDFRPCCRATASQCTAWWTRGLAARGPRVASLPGSSRLARLAAYLVAAEADASSTGTTRLAVLDEDRRAGELVTLEESPNLPMQSRRGGVGVAPVGHLRELDRKTCRLEHLLGASDLLGGHDRVPVRAVSPRAVYSGNAAKRKNRRRARRRVFASWNLHGIVCIRLPEPHPHAKPFWTRASPPLLTAQRNRCLTPCPSETSRSTGLTVQGSCAFSHPIHTTTLIQGGT